MAIITVTEANVKKEVEESTLPVVIDVYASWCGPCQQMAPIFSELEKEMGEKYKFAKVNIEESRELSIKMGVSKIPTFIFMKNNEVRGKTEGYLPKEDLKAKIEEFLG